MAQVLLVDDSAVMLNEVSTYLEAHEISTLMAVDGQEGFDLIRQHGAIPLAIVDINMPVMDGMRMIEKVRRELPQCQTRFVMLTTEFDRKCKERGKALGVRGWIIKPFRGDAAIVAIKKLLGDV